MKLHRWADIKDQGMTPSRIRQSKARVANDSLAIRLRAVREAAGLTQAELGKRATLSQSQLSRLEHSGNVQMATLARYLHAAGARLEMSAVVNGERLMLVSENEDGPMKVRTRSGAISVRVAAGKPNKPLRRRRRVAA
jgi:transcriptional regulator with XRE-family HTH domain